MVLLASALILAMTRNIKSVAAQVSETCKAETQELQSEEGLNNALDSLLTQYQENFDNLCRASPGEGFECGVTFDGANADYESLCQQAGGQIFLRQVELTCGVSYVLEPTFDLGAVPICIGASCDPQAIEPNDLEYLRVDTFVDELQLVGCEAGVEGSGARIVHPRAISSRLLAVVAIAALQLVR